MPAEWDWVPRPRCPGLRRNRESPGACPCAATSPTGIGRGRRRRRASPGAWASGLAQLGPTPAGQLNGRSNTAWSAAWRTQPSGLLTAIEVPPPCQGRGQPPGLAGVPGIESPFQCCAQVVVLDVQYPEPLRVVGSSLRLSGLLGDLEVEVEVARLPLPPCVLVFESSLDASASSM